MIGRAALGAKAARRPLVIKLTTDEAYERAQRRGLFDGDMDAFQHADGDLRIRGLRRSRDAALRQAIRVLCPSAYLRDMAVSWGVPADRALVIPNPAPDLPRLPTRDEARDRGRRRRPHARLRRADRPPEVARRWGSKPWRRWQASRCSWRVTGQSARRWSIGRASSGSADASASSGRCRATTCSELFRAADASLLSSTWENFPHTVVESLAVGTPVIATRVGGVGEVVRDGENGLLVPAGDAGALAAAIRRFYGERGLRERLAAAAAPSVAGYGREEMLSRIEAVLVEAAR